MTTTPAAGSLPAAAVLALIAASGLRTSSSGISRDILVEAMFRIEAAGLPIMLHVHDECVCEVPIGSGDEQEFVRLMTQPPSWAPDLPIAANAWRGYRYDKSEKSATSAIRKPAQPTVAAAAVADDEATAPNGTTQNVRRHDDDGPPIAPNPQPPYPTIPQSMTMAPATTTVAPASP